MAVHIGTEPVQGSTSRLGAPTTGAYGYLCVLILMLAYSFNFLDRQILSVLAEPVRRDLHLSDTQLGLLTGLAFALFYTVFGVPIAWFADRSHRVRIVAAACAVWSLFSMGGGLATNFAQLAFMRIGVGIGEAGGTTPSYAIISDYFPPHRRGMALAIYSLGVPVGVTGGLALGAWAAAQYGWRTAFFIVGAPGVLIALVILAVVREPVRGAQDLQPVTLTGERERLGAVIALFFRDPVLFWTALGTGLAAFIGYGLLNWIPAFLIRREGMSLAQIAGSYSLCTGVAIGLGMWASGYLADRLGRARPQAYALIPMWSFLAALPCIAGALLATTWMVTLVFATLVSALTIVYLSPALAVVQNRVPANARSTSAALLLFVLNLIGLGGGPLFVGAISDAAKPHFGAAAALQIGLLSLTPVCLLVVGCYAIAARAMARRASQASTAA